MKKIVSFLILILFCLNQTSHAQSTELGIMPVSYTHLRAHETVLDLVCRLLLEKTHITVHERVL